MRILLSLLFTVASLSATPRWTAWDTIGRLFPGFQILQGIFADTHQSASVSYLWHETFEGSASCGFGAYTNCDTTPFFGQSAIANYTTAPAPLQGTKSLEFADANGEYDADFTASNEVYGATEWAFSALPASESLLLELHNASNVTLCKALVFGSSFIYTDGGTGGTRQYAANNTASLVINTKYYIRLRAKIGTGSNAECQVWYSTDGASWTGSPSMTDAPFTTQPSRVTLRGATAITSVWDDIRVSTSIFNYP